MKSITDTSTPYVGAFLHVPSGTKTIRVRVSAMVAWTPTVTTSDAVSLHVEVVPRSTAATDGRALK